MKRHAMVILAVLIAIVIAAVIAMGALSIAASGADFSKASERSAQMRALVQSAGAAAAAELAAQREQLLAGAAPKLTGEWELFQDRDTGVRGAIKLMPAGAADASTSTTAGAVAQSLAARLDANAADESMLATYIGADAAARLVQQRARRPWTDPGECEDFLRTTPAAESMALSSPSPSSTADVAATPLTDPAGSNSPHPLSTFSFEPQLCPADPKSTTPGNWVPAVNIAGGITADAATRLTDLLGPELFEKLRTAIGAQPPADREALLNALQNAGVSQADWGRLLEVVCFNDLPFVIGRVDLNLAPPEVLACIPGISPEAARAITGTRERLDAVKRSQVTWPLTEQVLTADQFRLAADWLTTRSMVWEVRVQVSISRDTPKATLATATWVITVDVAGDTPRIVSIRDLSMRDGLQLALAAIPPEPSPALPDEPIPNNPRLDSEAEMKDDAQSGVSSDFPPPPQAADFPLIDSNPPATEPKDNRIGRWTTGAGR